MALTFRLKRHQLEDGTVTFHPYVKVVLSYAKKSQEVTGVLDTGADLIYLPLNVAEYFNLPLSKKTFECKSPQGLFKYKTSKMSVEIGKGHEKHKREFVVTIPLSEGEYDEVILGVEFLSQFKITFDYANERMVLKKSGKRTNLAKMKVR